MNIFNILNTNYKREGNELTKQAQLRTVTDNYIHKYLGKMVAEKLVEELYPEKKKKIMHDKDFMTELLNEVHLTLAKRLLEIK